MHKNKTKRRSKIHKSAAVNFDFILILINSDFILCNSNFDFILYYNLLLCFIQLQMHVHARLICAIKFCLLT